MHYEWEAEGPDLASLAFGEEYEMAREAGLRAGTICCPWATDETETAAGSSLL